MHTHVDMHLGRGVLLLLISKPVFIAQGIKPLRTKGDSNQRSIPKINPPRESQPMVDKQSEKYNSPTENR